jgi:hypothetical protein
MHEWYKIIYLNGIKIYSDNLHIIFEFKKSVNRITSDYDSEENP